jgi:hypothetical protein
MAGEYSRELSTKVFQGACRLIQLGFKQGGSAGYGLRRMLVDQAGQPRASSERGEHKSLQTDRVVLCSARKKKSPSVRSVYRAFLDEEFRARNRRATSTPGTPDRPRPTLDPRHGASASHQRKIHRQQRLSPDLVQTEAEARQNPPRCGFGRRGLFRCHPRLFVPVQEMILARAKRYTDDDMLTVAQGNCGPARPHLRSPHRRAGSDAVQRRLPSSFRQHWSGPISSSATRPNRFSFIEINRFLRGRKHPESSRRSFAARALGVQVERDPANELLILDRELFVSLVLSRCLRTPAGQPRWLVRFEEASTRHHDRRPDG